MNPMDEPSTADTGIQLSIQLLSNQPIDAQSTIHAFELSMITLLGTHNVYSLFYLAVLHMYHHLVWRIEEEEGRRNT